MKKIKDDPLLTIFNNYLDGQYEEIENIKNIPKFFEYLSSDQINEESKIGVIDNLLNIFKKNGYLLDYFSLYKNKSIYIFLFELYLSKNSSENLKSAILKLIDEFVFFIETNKEIYEFIFQGLSKIYNKEEIVQEKTPQNLYSYLILLNTLLTYKEKVPKPFNYFTLSGNGKFSLDLTNKKLNVGYCMSFIINFKIYESEKNEGICSLLNISFSNKTNIGFKLKAPNYLLIKEGTQNEMMLKGLPFNEFVILVVNLIVENNNLNVYYFVNGENKLSPIKYKNNLDLKTDYIESIDFFENFYGEVTSITMFLQKEKSNPTINSVKFLPSFKQFSRGFHKKKVLQKFIDIISDNIACEGQTLSDKISSEHKLKDNLVFIFTPFNYFNSYWDKKNIKEENKKIDDYFNKYILKIIDKDNSIRNHRFQYYQKKIHLVCKITNFLPIAEMFLIHPQLLTEQNLVLFLQIIENILNYRKRNVESAKETSFFKIISLFIEKYPNQIFTENILDAFIKLGKDMFKNNFDKLTNTYFKHILLNEKILSKYSQNLQIKFWNQLLLFCESDSDQLKKFIKMNRICLILRFYDKNKYKEMCCRNHLDMFKKEYNKNCNIMEPSMDIKLKDIWKIIDLIINSQEPEWVLSLFKLLMLDLSPCLSKFIIIATIKALIRHDENKDKSDMKKVKEDLSILKNMIFVRKVNSWLKTFMEEMNSSNYEIIIVNAFIHSLPDVKFDILKLIYQIYQALIYLKKKDNFKIFFNMMKKYLLPQQMFYEKINDKENIVINDIYLNKYLNDVILLFIYWILDEKLIETNDEIYFNKNIKFDVNAKIKNSDIFEVIFELFKQINYNTKLILMFLEILNDLTKNPINCNILLYNYKIFLYFINLVYECYILKLNNNEKNKDIEKCYSLGKSILTKIYINDLIYKENKYIDDNYTFNEISLFFLWGDKIIFNKNEKNNKIINNIFSYISDIFQDILMEFKLKIFPKMKNNSSTYNVIQNFIKSNYRQNYLIFMGKLFEFSFEYNLDPLIKINNNLKSIISTNDVMIYNSRFLTSMRIDEIKEKSISIYWKDYHFFEELYNRINYMWKKEYLYKDFNKDNIKNSNKLEKYEYILEKIILNKRNLFKKELEFLSSFYIKENEYDIYGENKDEDDFVEIITNNNLLNITLLKQIQIVLISMLTVIDSKENKEEFEKWLKELKHFCIFIIIGSTNIILKEKKDKESSDKNYISYMYLQEQCSYTLYNCLNFLFQLRSISSVCKDKIDKACISVYTLSFVILKYTYNYRKKNKISKKFSIGYKYNTNDLSGSSIFILFNEYVKEKKKEKDKGDNCYLTLDKLNTILDKNNYSKNIIKLLEGSNWNDSFYKNNNIKDILSEKYFPIMEYKTVVEKRLNTIKKIDEQSNSIDGKWEYSIDEILKLLPLYEKELVHYSNNSLEKNLTKKNLYKIIKKNLFSWNGYWSDRTLFYQENNNSNINCKSNIKYKLVNHYTKSFMKPLLVPILDIHYYLPDFSGFNPENIFNNKEKFIVNMDLDKIIKLKEEQKKSEDEKINLKENYLRKIYIKSSTSLAEKLMKISDSLELGKEEEFSIFKEEKEENENNNNKEEKNKNYYLCCLVKSSHHIKGVCFIDKITLDFKVFLNQKTGNAMSGVNIGFTDKDDDYDNGRKTCFGSYFMFHQKDKNLYRISIKYEDIKLILLKRYYYKNSALEIFTLTNKSYYFNFKYEEDRDKFINNILCKFKEAKTIINDFKENKDNFYIIGYSIKPQTFKDKRKYTRKEIEKKDKSEKKKTVKKLSKKIKEWATWKINNFSFIMWMNFFSNRSYNDISQYPIFPWILCNYDDPLKIESIYYESSLNNINSTLNEENFNRSKSNMSESSIDEFDKKNKKKRNEEEYNYRDLKLPMGMLEINEESKKRKNEFIELYNTLKEDKDEFENRKPYYYGSNYSNPVYTCNFLMRLFPFTHISIELQGSKLDDPNRLFLSVSKSFNNSISQKTDVRELIPEFFYLPEMFLNINDINLGKLEDNSIVDNVITPCNNNPYSFIEIMKRIFENNRISSYINNWVDLIFGYKSKGKEAEIAKNIFTESSYQENINLKNIEEKESYLRSVEFGLIPNQIMNKECSKREKKREIRKEKELTEYNCSNANKLKITLLKNNNSNDKNMKNDEKKSKILKADIINKDRIIILYDNNTIIENKINNNNIDICCTYKIKQIENRINKKYAEKINNKIIKFCNFGTVLIIGGYYDGRIEIIYLEDKIEKKRKIIYPFSEEQPILSISINNDETFMILGNSIGNIVIYKIDIENCKWTIFKKRFHQMNAISDIHINNDLNLFASSSIDGIINLYTLPLCKLVRSIKVPINIENNGKCNYVLLSESSLSSIIVINEDNNNCEILSYSINGKLLTHCKEDKTMSYPLKIKDLNTFEYIVYYANSQIIIRNLPSLTVQIIIKSIFNYKNLCINDDLTTIYILNEDGTHIQAIRN